MWISVLQRVIVCVFILCAGMTVLGQQPESKDALHVYQFQDGVLIYKFKIPTKDWGGGGLDQMYFLDDATDVYLMVGNQGKWVKGGLKDEPPAQAVLDRWNRKQEWETVKPLREGYHEVIRANESADENTSHYPALQPKKKSSKPLVEVFDKNGNKLDNIGPVGPSMWDEPVPELPPPPAPPKFGIGQRVWFNGMEVTISKEIPNDGYEVYQTNGVMIQVHESELSAKRPPIVKQLKEKIQEHRRERYVFQKIGDGTFLLNNEDGRVWKLYDYDGTTKWVMTKDKDQ